DTMGRFRSRDNGKAVDATATVLGEPVDGGVALAQRLAGSTEVAACVAGHFVRYALAVGPDDADACLIGRAARAVRGPGGFRDMLLAIAPDPAFFALSN